jgi:predicted metal-dependent HD superfamily phosphohydrolase
LTAGGLPAEVVGRIVELILATRHQAVSEGRDAALLCDIDLSILGRDAAAFDAHDRAIRAEYEWVPEEQYREGRSRILSGFLSRPFIFQTEALRTTCEQPARENLRRAVERLTDRGGA